MSTYIAFSPTTGNSVARSSVSADEAQAVARDNLGHGPEDDFVVIRFDNENDADQAWHAVGFGWPLHKARQLGAVCHDPKRA